MTRRALIIGLGIIAIANAGALGSAAYNRMGEPDSELALTERELRRTNGKVSAENSGVELRIEWCTRDTSSLREVDEIAFELQGCYNRAPYWLDARRLQDLGFDMTVAPTSPEAARHYSRLLPRPAFFVLELGSPWYGEMLERSRAFVARREAAAALAPDSAALRREVAALRRRFAWLERGASRLYLIDAARDASELRAKYSDRSRYAIVRGTVKPTIRTSIAPGKTVQVIGQIEIKAITVNVPAKFQPLLQNVVRGYDFSYDAPPPSRSVTVSVAFGRRLEPWITNVK